jgi:pathogenesis-related protein 1
MHRSPLLTAALAALTGLGCGSTKSQPRGTGTAPMAHPPTASGASCGHHGDPEPAPLVGITAAHNAVRCRVSRPSAQTLPPLSWSQPLAAHAQRYADSLARNGCNLQHSQTEHGENLFGGSGKNTPAEVVTRWAGEEQCFHYANFPASCSCTCGHYTQLVWADTTRLGCGMARCANGSEVWVCNYDPAGNYVGSAPY